MGYENMLLIVVLIGIVLFGAKKIPDLARSVGRAQVEYEKARIQARKEISSLVEEKREVQASGGQDSMKADEQPAAKVELGGASEKKEEERDAGANGNVVAVVYDNATTTRLRNAARKIGVSNPENLTDEELREAIRRNLLP